MSYKIKFIKYFSPDGRDEVPDGVYFQKGGFIQECQLNRAKFRAFNFQFIIKKGIIEQFEKEEEPVLIAKGAIIVLPNHEKVKEAEVFNYTKNEFEENQKFLLLVLNESKVFLSVGKLFYGRFGTLFDEQSLCIEINGINWKWMVGFAERLMKNYSIERALIKELASERIFIIVNQ